MKIDTLKQQHRELMQLIRQVDGALELPEAAGVLTALSSLCQALRAHVALEDQKLYPELACTAETREGAKMLETAYRFFSNMPVRRADALSSLRTMRLSRPILFSIADGSQPSSSSSSSSPSSSCSVCAFKSWLKLSSTLLLMASKRLSNSVEDKPKRSWRRCFIPSWIRTSAFVIQREIVD